MERCSVSWCAASRGDAPSEGAWELRRCDEPAFRSFALMDRLEIISLDWFQYFR